MVGMSPANALVLAMAFQCAAAAVCYELEDKHAQALMFTGYVIANLGILWTAMK